MIHLNTVAIKAFRSFVDETVFNLPDTGLVLINGKNLDTNDASGTGKSTLFYAVAYATGILSGITAKELQCLYTKEKLQVTLNLTDDRLGRVVIGKGKENFIEYMSQRFEGAKLAQEHTERVFGLKSEMLSTLMFRPQGTNGLVLSKTSTQLVEFLGSLLELDVIEAALEEANNKIKALSKDVDSFDIQVKSKTETLGLVQSEDVTLLTDQNVELTNKLKDLNEQKEELERKIDAVSDQEKIDNKAISDKYGVLKNQARVLVAQLESEDKTSKKEIEVFNDSVSAQVKAINFDLFVIKLSKNDVASYQKEIETLASANCPTCERGWTESGGKLEATTKKLQEVLEGIAKEPGLLKTKADLESQLKTWAPNPQIHELELAVKGFDIAAMGERVTGRASGYMNSISKNIREQVLLTDAISKNNIKIEKSNESKRIRDQLTKDIATIEGLLTNKKKELQIELDFVQVVGKKGFLGSIFDEVLSEIVVSINKKLSLVANMAHVTFNFKTEALDSKGLTKKSIIPVVFLNGNETSMAALSGGMKSSLELLTDLAVKETIETRTGKAIGWYFADEAFNGQGQPTKEACLDIMKQCSQCRALFVIDHHSETKEYFNKIIDIEMRNGISSVV